MPSERDRGNFPKFSSIVISLDTIREYLRPQLVGPGPHLVTRVVADDRHIPGKIVTCSVGSQIVPAQLVKRSTQKRKYQIVASWSATPRWLSGVEWRCGSSTLRQSLLTFFAKSGYARRLTRRSPYIPTAYGLPSKVTGCGAGNKPIV